MSSKNFRKIFPVRIFFIEIYLKRPLFKNFDEGLFFFQDYPSTLYFDSIIITKNYATV